MSRCSSCAAAIAPGESLCPRCAATIAIPTETVADQRQRIPMEGRFLPGTVIAGRYRIVSPAGTGGMGEVYRATDLKLGQTVALKFLPERVASDPAALARFHNEVRIARQISHPNVCRVYDIGDVEGHHFISMEFVDGEDLAALLRRIGRLPPDKALEIARGLAAGLAAAHANGVLHRDLKPSNVMLDGRGHARITDFGLAAAAGQVEDADVGSGTPAYMAPEQLAGKEVTVRSDIYGLGLVLYEIFTGRRAFNALTVSELRQLKERSLPATPSSTTTEIEPAVERVIMRCLDPDPQRRPVSVLAVAAALPGGNPLAAAVAAGETPSPDLVASAGEQEGLRPLAAVACATLAIGGLMAVAFMNNRSLLITQVPFELTTQELSAKARGTLERLGYSERRQDRSSGLDYAFDMLLYTRRREHRALQRHFHSGNISPIKFWHRESPEWMYPLDPTRARVAPSDPPVTTPGMVLLQLDSQGRLLHFHAVPPARDENPSPATAPDWHIALSAAGFNATRLKPAVPKLTPPNAWDHRSAWEGSFAEADDVPVRVEAASWRGRVVYLELVWPWTTNPESLNIRAGVWVGTGILVIVLASAAWFARRNVRLGRGDRSGAFRVATCVAALRFASAVLVSHTPVLAQSSRLFTWAALSITAGFLVWVFYLALEPLVRRRWPETMIGWSRLVGGRFFDPLVARDFLIGTLLGVGWCIAFSSLALQRRAEGVWQMQILSVMEGPRQFLGQVLASTSGVLLFAFGLFLLLFLFRVLLRRDVAGGIAFTVLFAAVTFAFDRNLVAVVSVGVQMGLAAFVVLRYGFLAFSISVAVSIWVSEAHFNSHLTAWYGTPSAMTFAFCAAIALLACRYTAINRWSLPPDVA